MSEDRNYENRDNRDSRDNRDNRDNRDEGQGGGRSGPPSGGKGERGGRPFRRKVCPFLADKTIILDYKNIRMIQRFVTETGKIVPRHVSGVSAKYQRQLTTHIKRARSLGLIAPLAEE
jgi:small subunit ribosomal protein S18